MKVLRRKTAAFALVAALSLQAGCGAQGQIPDQSAEDGQETVIEIEAQLPSADLTAASIEPVEDQIYTGEQVIVSPVIEVEGSDLLSGRDYEVAYADNIGVGTATITVTGNGSTATGIIETTFNILTGDPVCDSPDNEQLRSFVYRLYLSFLGRYPDFTELIDNVRRLRSGSRSGIEAVNIILQSDEFLVVDMDDSAFVQAFYRGVLNREADESGLFNNVNLLSEGMGRLELCNSIMDVPGGEFASICESLGISLGSGSVAGAVPDVGDRVPSSAFNYSVDGNTVTVRRRVYQFIERGGDEDIFDLQSMCEASGFVSSDSGENVYSSGVYTLTLEDGLMTLSLSGEEIFSYEDVIDEGEETFKVKDIDMTVSIGMVVMIERSLELSLQ